jgi:hypothetical protein
LLPLCECFPRRLGPRDVPCLHALLALGRLIGDLLTFIEGLVPSTCYPAVVHEEILASITRGDKAVALLVVEPLDRSLGHVLEPTFLSLGFLTMVEALEVDPSEITEED